MCFVTCLYCRQHVLLHVCTVGGMFHYISGANYFGETLEWCGYAVACWNWPAAAFAVFTLLMLGARAVQYHRSGSGLHVTSM